MASVRETPFQVTPVIVSASSQAIAATKTLFTLFPTVMSVTVTWSLPSVEP